ncbi:MAG TPA: hypothetical protein VE959_05525 [Bryobacteraceae bacterium]|nr:hypothetical protein [Bryobacteraceae bacterium]
MLQSENRAGVAVFVIWEPVLATDWLRPGPAQTSFVRDGRATHFWDHDHLLSALYQAQGSLARTEKVGFRMKNVIWDTALVYPPGVKWGAPASLMVAPVVNYHDELERALAER